MIDGFAYGVHVLETISEREGEVRIAVVLTQKVVAMTRDPRAGDRSAPVLALRLRVLGSGVDTIAILAHRGLHRQATVGIYGV